MEETRAANSDEEFVVLFGSEDELYSDEGEDVSGHPYWEPMLAVAAKFGPPIRP